MPLWDHKGNPTLGVFADGAAWRCRSVDGEDRCVLLAWPAGWSAYAKQVYAGQPRSFWHGSLLEDRGDYAGTRYKRNRYYDPQTGRFTQEDPIGLAGGLNLYGFAGGDPVNLSDPFGLCPELEDTDGTICLSLFIQEDAVLDLVGDNRDFSSSSDPDASRVYLHIDPENRSFSATANPTCTTDGMCAEPLASNQIDVTFGEDGGFTVSINAKNSILPGPSINGTFSFTPDGQGGFTTSGNRDAFPSAEAYLWRGGKPTTLFQRPERTPWHLLPPFPNDQWR